MAQFFLSGYGHASFVQCVVSQHDCNSVHAYSEISLTVFSGVYSQVDVHGIVARVNWSMNSQHIKLS